MSTLSDLDPLSAEFLLDPYKNFRRLREEAPVHFVAARNMWIVTRYEDVVSAAKNTAVFSSTGGVGYDWNQRPMMPMYDPPEHTRMRRMVAKFFTPAAIAAFKSDVEEHALALVARAIEKKTIDIVQDIALPLSLHTMAELLGVPPDLRERLRRWSQGTVLDLAGGIAGSEARAVDELRREFNVYLRSLIEERRTRTGGKDVISALVLAEENEKLTAQELVAFCVLLLVAGYETTVNAISNGVLALAEHPAENEKLRADKRLVSRAIEEMVRYDGPVLSFFRNTLSDVDFGGQKIPKASKVMLAFASANRDERKFEKADSFWIDRPSALLSDHLGYGSGVHFCLGAPLARVQLSSIFSALNEHVNEITMLGTPTRTASVLFRGVKSFPVRIVGRGGSSLERRSAQPSISPPSGAAHAVKPFRIDVKEDVLDDLKRRLEGARFPDQIEWSGWDYGTPVSYLRELVDHWKNRYDWREQEEKLNQLGPQFRATVGEQRIPIHFVHRKKKNGRTPLPLLLLHGWPGPYRLFSRLANELRDDSFDLVIASLPGFVFSGAAKQRGMGTKMMADLFAQLMSVLGYERFGVVGEDWGAGVASRLALAYPERVTGIHLNMPHENPPRDQMTSLTPEEKGWLREMGRFRDRSLTHFPVHERQPQSLAYGLNDSPIGLTGWLVDKYRAWSDCDGDVERRFAKDDLITNIMLYWTTGSIASAIRVYYESRQLPWFLGAGEKIPVPTAIALCKHELVKPPRRWIERVYNLTRLTEIPAGGHFGAWEEPAAIAKDIREFFAP